MKKFLLISDLDGTICRSAEGRMKDAADIAAFRSQGNLFVIDSGRSLPSLLYAVENKGLSCDYLLASTSAVCYKDDSVVFSVKVDAAILYEIYEYLQRINNLIFVIARENEEFYIKTNRETRQVNGVELCKDNYCSIGFFNQCSAVFATTEEATEATSALNEKFNSHINAFQNGVCIDIVKKDHNKAVGIKLLAEKLGIQHSDIYTIGDNYNDIPMLKDFNSFVVSSGVPKVKQYASKDIVDDIGKAIEIILLNK